MAPSTAIARQMRPRLQEESEAEFEDEYDSFEDGVDYYPEDASEGELQEIWNGTGRHASFPPRNGAGTTGGGVKVNNRMESESDDEGLVEDDENDEEEEEHEDEDSDEDENEDDSEDAQEQISRTSFGALKQAQDDLSRKRKRSSDTNEMQEEKLAALRSRLKELRAKSDATSMKAKTQDSALSRSVATAEQDSDEEDSDSAPSEEGAPTKSRTSKHAPAAQSSKYQVTRKRNVINVPKRNSRDPRFDALHGQPVNLKDHSEKAYAFLDDYQKSEIKELRTAIKATRDEDEKETLRRKMVSMENRLKAKAAKERERDVVRKHRREEREKIEQGKLPYYLKTKDVKQKALEEKFNSMKGKDREKLMERRRKKEGQKEKKRMPRDRRVER